MQSGLATNTRRPAAAGKSRVGFLVNNLWHSPRGVSEVWQTQGLEIGVFGSVAVAGLMGEFSDVWQGKELRGWRGTRVGGTVTREAAISALELAKSLVVGQLR